MPTSPSRPMEVSVRNGSTRWMLWLGLALCLVPIAMIYNNRVHGAELAYDPSTEPIVGQEDARVAIAPNVPPPIDRKHATRVILNVEVREHVKELADGVQYLYWSFGDETPAKFIRVREGDLVETHFSNHPDNQLAHNIDFHGATRPGGCGAPPSISPGLAPVFTRPAMRPGLSLPHGVPAPAGAATQW